MNFIKQPSLIKDSYTLNISRLPFIFKEICVYTQKHNQFVYLREGDLKNCREEDNLVTIFNSDLNGELTINWIKNLVNLLK